MNKPRTIFALLLGLSLATWAVSGCFESNEGPRPNVILITMDTTRADYLSCYGYKRETSPNMDRLAGDGVRFARAMSSSAVTPVSHATILTGLYQYEHGVRVIGGNDGRTLAPETQSLSTVLKAKGYHLGAVHSSFPVSAHFGFDQGFDVFESLEAKMRKGKLPVFDPKTNQQVVDDQGNKVFHPHEYWDASATRRSDVTTDLALEFLDDSSGPFFLWIHYWDPHDNGQTPPEEFCKPEFWIQQKNGPKRTDDFYAEEIRYMDGQLGRLFDGLRERGLYEESFIVLTADHGEGLTDGKRLHGWHAHRETYAEQLHVPLIFKLPASLRPVQQESVVSTLVGTVDILPTVAQVMDVPLKEAVSGESLLGLMSGEASERAAFYADQINGFDPNAAMVKKRPSARFIYSAFDNDWKVIYRPTETNPKELYNISVDPREKNNLASDPSHRSHLDRLMIDLANKEGWVTGGLAPGGTKKDVNMDGLGYSAVSQLFDGSWKWVCPVEHDGEYPTNTRCATCNEKLVPIAIPAEPKDKDSGSDSKKSGGGEGGK